MKLTDKHKKILIGNKVYNESDLQKFKSLFPKKFDQLVSKKIIIIDKNEKEIKSDGK